MDGGNTQGADLKPPKIRCANCFDNDNSVWESTIRVHMARPKRLGCLAGLPAHTPSGHYLLLNWDLKVITLCIQLYNSLYPISPNTVRVAVPGVCWQWCSRYNQTHKTPGGHSYSNLTWKCSKHSFHEDRERLYEQLSHEYNGKPSRSQTTNYH